MPILKIVENNDLVNIIQCVNAIVKNEEITHIYISIGGKINKKETDYNNSIYHLLPSYLTFDSNNSMIIVLDIFTKYDYNKCIEYTSQQGGNVILCNCFVDIPFITEFIPYIINFSKTILLEPKNLVICNYVKFKNIPNEKEMISSHNIPTNIYNILQQPEFIDYIDCFYEWFGYHNTLRNFIYNYKYYQLYRGAHTPLILLSDTLRTIECDNTYKLELFDMKIINFWNYIYDITENKNTLTSIYDILQEEGKIVKK
jgi:hypothetical protein